MKKMNYPWKYGWFLGLYYMANGVYQGYAGKYFESRGTKAAFLSVLLALMPFVSIFMQPVWGIAGDRTRNRNRLLGVLVAASAGAVLLYALSDSFYWLLVISALFSAFYTSIQPMGDSIVLEVLLREGQPFGPLRLIGTLSFGVGNLIWGLLLTAEHMQRMLPLTALLLGAVLIASRVLPPTAGHQATGGQKLPITAILKVKHMPDLLLLLMLLQLTMGYFYSFFSIHFTSLEGGSSRLLGLCYFISAMSEIPFLLCADSLFERLGAGRLMTLSALVLTIRWLILAASRRIALVMLSQMLHGGGFIVMSVSMAKHAAAALPEELKTSGQMLIAMAGFGVARVFGILGGGLLADMLGGVQQGFWLMAGVAAVGLVIFAPKYARMEVLNGKTK